MTGRPTDYTEELADQICEAIVAGQSVREIARQDKFPAMATIFRWLGEEDKVYFKEQYVRAKEAQIEFYAEEILDIADDATNDWMERENKDGSKFEVINQEHIQRSRLRIESRKWLMGKLKPKKYGDKTQLTGADGEGPVETKMQVEFVSSENKDKK